MFALYKLQPVSPFLQHRITSKIDCLTSYVFLQKSFHGDISDIGGHSTQDGSKAQVLNGTHSSTLPNGYTLLRQHQSSPYRKTFDRHKSKPLREYPCVGCTLTNLTLQIADHVSIIRQQLYFLIKNCFFCVVHVTTRLLKLLCTYIYNLRISNLFYKNNFG